jgi:type 2 lantibiotic biosynthesis protein LanM
MDLNTIVTRAAFLYERMQPPFMPEETPESPELVRRRMEGWRRNVAKDEDEQFESRLAQDQLTAKSAEALAGGARMESSAPLPAWAACLAEIVQLAAAFSNVTLEEMEKRYQYLCETKPPVFQHFMVPFVEYASTALQHASPGLVSAIAPSALADLQRALLHSLSTAARDTLYLEFSIWRSCNLLSEAEHTVAGEQSFESRIIYGSFISGMWTGGLAKLVDKYPVLGRMLAQITQLWILSTSEFLGRLQNDRAEIGRTFSPNAPPGACVRIKTGLSDRHNGGRTVLGVEFQNGTGVIYKSKNPQSQQMLDEFFHWLGKNTELLPMHICRAVYRNDYYWVEQISPGPCQNDDEVARYYQRAGALACIMYLLGGYDFHADNLIACGEHPVIIDTETILHPELRLTSDSFTGELHDSVLRTCMFPRRSRRQPRKDYNCGLAHKGTTTRAFSRIVWQDANSDRMSPHKQEMVHPPSLNLVYLGDRVVPAEERLKDILAGFAEMYEALMKMKERLFEAGGPLAGMSCLQPRFVFRNTAAYEQVLRDAWQPQYLGDGMETSLRFDALSRALLRHSSNLRFWPLLVSEHAALALGDIPMFFHSADTGALIVGKDNFLELKNARECSGYTMMCRRFESMSLMECEKQMSDIVESFNPE